jgi:uncharacterized protein YecT (DUF1311 family)
MIGIKNLKIALATIYISGFTALSSILPVSAETQINCVDLKSNAEYKECAYREYQAADRKLNQVYKPIFSSLTGKHRQQLVNAQSNWIKFRDANCDFEVYQTRGGSVSSGFLSTCLERMTWSRTRELQEWRRYN